MRPLVDPIPPPEIDGDEPEDEVRRTARETVAADLKDWQDRYAKAADEGAAEIEDRVEEITKRMIRRNARAVGKAALNDMVLTITTGLQVLREEIMDTVSLVNNGAIDHENASDRIVSAVRKAGMGIKQKAQAVRTWRAEYEAELQDAITQTAQNHISILEGIRDLALQRIGMKWAWMEGITYKDWAKYHLLRSRFDEWQDDLEKLVVTHPGLEAAQQEGASIEDEAMTRAAAAAAELGRLKQVGGWKVVAGDATDEFDGVKMEMAAEAAEWAKALEEKKAKMAAEQAKALEVEQAKPVVEDPETLSPVEAIDNEAPSSVEAAVPDSEITETAEPETTTVMAEETTTTLLLSRVSEGTEEETAEPHPIEESDVAVEAILDVVDEQAPLVVNEEAAFVVEEEAAFTTPVEDEATFTTQVEEQSETVSTAISALSSTSTETDSEVLVAAQSSAPSEPSASIEASEATEKVLNVKDEL
jgi:hypothetical protein